jgi:hypothetical protein
MNPFTVLNAALSKVPGLKILFGIVALLSILAIAKAWSLDRGWTIVGGIAIVFFAIILLALASLARTSVAKFATPAMALFWFCIILFMVWCCLLTSCVFFRWPISVEAFPLKPQAAQAPRLTLEQSRLIDKSGTETNATMLTSWKNIGGTVAIKPEFRTIIEDELLASPLYIARGQYADIDPTATRLITDRLPDTIRHPWTNLLIYNEVIFEDSNNQMFTQRLVTRPLIVLGHASLSDVRTEERDKLERHFRAAAEKLDLNTKKEKERQKQEI